jgi:cysteine-rich repeat protein
VGGGPHGGAGGSTGTDTGNAGAPPLLCGDGIVASGEGCDDGNALSHDGCSAECQPEPGYTCLGGSICVIVCGDGIVSGTELCDDGNREDDDGCPNDCGIDSSAGSGGTGAGGTDAGSGGAPPRPSCWYERARSTSGCVGNQVLMDQAYATCSSEHGEVDLLDFDDSCNVELSRSLKFECCPPGLGAAGTGGTGGIAGAGG